MKKTEYHFESYADNSQLYYVYHMENGAKVLDNEELTEVEAKQRTDDLNNGQRIGCVLVFRKEVTAEQARQALESIQHLLAGRWLRNEDDDKPYSKQRFDASFRLETYNGAVGGPVWYIP